MQIDKSKLFKLYESETIVEITACANDGGVVLFALTNQGHVLLNDHPFAGVSESRWQEVKLPNVREITLDSLEPQTKSRAFDVYEFAKRNGKDVAYVNVSSTQFGEALGKRHLLIHPFSSCAKQYCPFHNPSQHELVNCPINVRLDNKSLVERICSHGVGHPDPDSVAYFERKGIKTMATHGCDGCCLPPEGQMKVRFGEQK